MFDGQSVATALKACGVTHVVWVPDGVLGQWDAAFSNDSELTLVRVCREGEAIAVAAGLHVGGKRPIVVMQCTGLFEAGDSLRNFIHDLKVPLFLLIGVRSYYAHRAGATGDTCPLYTEPILQAWGLSYSVLDRRHAPTDLAAHYLNARAEGRPGAVLLAE